MCHLIKANNHAVWIFIYIAISESACVIKVYSLVLTFLTLKKYKYSIVYILIVKQTYRYFPAPCKRFFVLVLTYINTLSASCSRYIYCTQYVSRLQDATFITMENVALKHEQKGMSFSVQLTFTRFALNRSQ